MTTAPELMHNLLSVQPLKWYSLADISRAMGDLSESFNAPVSELSIGGLISGFGIFFIVMSGIGSILIMALTVFRLMPIKHACIVFAVFLAMTFLGSEAILHVDNVYIYKGKQIIQSSGNNTFKMDLAFSFHPVTEEAEKFEAPEVNDLKIISYDDNFIYMEPVLSKGKHVVFSIENKRFISKLGYSYYSIEPVVSKPIEELKQREKGFENSRKAE